MPINTNIPIFSRAWQGLARDGRMAVAVIVSSRERWMGITPSPSIAGLGVREMMAGVMRIRRPPARIFGP
jgi:hypothetical protein